MPLSPPAERSLLHRRDVACRGYRRADGLWDIEGHLVDTKSYDFDNHDRGTIRAGEPLHEMWVRVTIDDDFVIREVEAVTDHGPFNQCGAITPAFAQLAGLRIGRGFIEAVKERLGGVKGCTHLVELMGPIATTAYQTLFPTRERRSAEQPRRSRPRVIDQCHALAADGEVVARLWPEFYEGSSKRSDAAGS